jgi:hypothetical protein
LWTRAWEFGPSDQINSESVILSLFNKEKKIVENGGQRNSQEENEKKIRFHKKFLALWTRASESGHLVQIFDSVSVIWGFFNIFK